MRAGAMEVCITPPIGVELAGYGPNLRRYATDIHDQLMKFQHRSRRAAIRQDSPLRCTIKRPSLQT